MGKPNRKASFLQIPILGLPKGALTSGSPPLRIPRIKVPVLGVHRIRSVYCWLARSDMNDDTWRVRGT